MLSPSFTRGAMALALTVVVSGCVPTTQPTTKKPNDVIANFYAEARKESQRINNEAEYAAFLNEYGKGCYIMRAKFGWGNNPTCWRIYTELVTVGERKGFRADPHNLSEAKRAKTRADRERRERAGATNRANSRNASPLARHSGCGKPGTAAYVYAQSNGLC